uniref:NADH dehydrogenase subunit 6 n=1 Tax=Eurhadina cuii TaxID=1287892 RepID=UPI0022DCE2FC|nr:NADH dehydrogenase subunit 6 [Eurhadina cuii]UGN61495.1 NADH dehydrogenase subunit 6 [Eurhadina cuii]
MKFILLKMTMIVSSFMVIMNHPMSMGFMLMLQTITIIAIMNKILSSSWFTMITFMMMIGGLLIMFMYMSSIASNEKFKLKINMTMIIMIMIMIQDEMMIQNQINELQEIMETKNLNLSLTKIYNKKSMLMTMMLVLYLLLTMISVTKMVKHHKGPLRSN